MDAGRILLGMNNSGMLGALAVVCSVAACGKDVGPVVPPALKLDTLATGMSNPLYVTAPRGDRTRVFIAERTGTIRIIKNGVLEAKPFLDITAEVSTGAEHGG